MIINSSYLPKTSWRICRNTCYFGWWIRARCKINPEILEIPWPSATRHAPWPFSPFCFSGPPIAHISSLPLSSNSDHDILPLSPSRPMLSPITSTCLYDNWRRIRISFTLVIWSIRGPTRRSTFRGMGCRAFTQCHLHPIVTRKQRYLAPRWL